MPATAEFRPFRASILDGSAFQLAGQNDNVQSLITGTKRMNTVMKRFEDAIRSYIVGTGNHVMYRVSPDFSGDDLVARGVRLEALSVEDGGAGIYITRKLEPLKSGICSGYMSSRYTEYPGKDAVLTKGSERVDWDEETSGFALNGEAEFSGSAAQKKHYTLRLFYAAESPWKMELCCNGYTTAADMPASGAIRTFITHNLIIPIEEGPFKIRLKRISGKAPAIWKLKLVDNDPFPAIHYDVKEGCLKGGGEIIAADDGVPTAVHLGRDAELVFDDVRVPESGRYVLRILYAAGDNRDISIQANQEEPVHTYLHNTSGW